MQIKIIPNDKGNPAGKLADAEARIHGRPAGGPEADRLRHLGTSHRRRSQRHLPGPPLLGQR